MYQQSVLNGIPNIIKESSNGFYPISIHDDLYQRRLILCTESITKEYIDSLVFQILQLDRVNPDEIAIYINSYGGEVMAGLLFICGDKREMLPHSKIMFHEPLISQLSQKNASEFEEITRDLLQTKQCPAEIVAILGSSGSGKSTFLHIICGLEFPKREISSSTKRISPSWNVKRGISVRSFRIMRYFLILMWRKMWDFHSKVISRKWWMRCWNL